MRSSPTLTFSPSERCLDAGWIVHQQDSPINVMISRPKYRERYVIVVYFDCSAYVTGIEYFYREDTDIFNYQTILKLLN